MGDLTKNFSRWEFACPCGCGFAAISMDLINNVLEPTREKFGPVRITSACRCHQHNRTVGGVSRSLHLLGKAADIQVTRLGRLNWTAEDPYPNKTTVPPLEVGLYINDILWCGIANEKRRYGGIIVYKTFTHVDTREQAFRRGLKP